MRINTIKYHNKTFSLPVSTGKISSLEYDYRVGRITKKEYERLLKQQEKK